MTAILAPFLYTLGHAALLLVMQQAECGTRSKKARQRPTERLLEPDGEDGDVVLVHVTDQIPEDRVKKRAGR